MFPNNVPKHNVQRSPLQMPAKITLVQDLYSDKHHEHANECDLSARNNGFNRTHPWNSTIVLSGRIVAPPFSNVALGNDITIFLAPQ